MSKNFVEAVKYRDWAYDHLEEILTKDNHDMSEELFPSMCAMYSSLVGFLKRADDACEEEKESILDMLYNFSEKAEMSILLASIRLLNDADLSVLFSEHKK